VVVTIWLSFIKGIVKQGVSRPMAFFAHLSSNLAHTSAHLNLERKTIQQMTEKHRIMVVSHDPHLADVRKALLEAAGFQVVSASNLKAVQEGCEGDPHLVMIGYSLPPAEKRRVWTEVRARCSCPILELHKDEEPTLSANAFFHYAARPDDFLAAVRRLLTKAS
jgi:CheY-like chemotaxis protein